MFSYLLLDTDVVIVATPATSNTNDFNNKVKKYRTKLITHKNYN